MQSRLRLRLLVDECLCSGELLERLHRAGFDALAARDVLGAAADDRLVFAKAQDDERAVLTADCGDFAELHRRQPDHSGLLLVYEDGDSRDIGWDEIVAALARVEATFSNGVTGHAIVLNHYRG